MKEKKEKLVTVARFDDYMKADLARQLLEDEGIKAFVMGQNVGNVGSGVPAVVDIELQTPASEAEEAREILEANKPQAGEGEFEEDEDVEEDEDLDEDEPDPDEGPQDVQE
jgi:hypothetical protein